MLKIVTVKVWLPGEGTFTRTYEKGDYGARYADEKLQEITRRLRTIYQQAADDLFAKQGEWIEKHQKRVEKYQRMVDAGEITQQDFEAWMRGQLFQERAWALKRGQLAREMVDIDKQAQAIVNGGKMDVFAENANYMGFKIDQQTGGAAASFGLYDRQSVARLIRDKPNLLPMPEIDEGKDYAWYNDIINNAVTHGILQGESLDQIAKRISEETGEKAFHTLRRNARTAYTGAQNAGRIEGMRQARDELGIDVKKRWLCTLDSHTRDAHAALDGQTVDFDEPFDSILGPIMYPGDPNAEPANVYNCRCTLEEVPDGHSWKMERRDAEEGGIVEDMNYREWLKMKNGG